MLIEELRSENSGQIQKGKFAGRATHYRSALLQVLRYLKPKRCLEIGTHYGESTKVFQKYFNEMMPDGHLVTCDIRDYINNYSSMPNVEFRQVYAHNPDVEFWHRVTDHQMLPNWRDVDSFQENLRILTGDSPYDFAFVDGDHTFVSCRNDIKIAVALTQAPHYIFMDNINDEAHDSVRVFWDEIHPSPEWETYTFDNWTCDGSQAVDFALMWRK